LPIVASDNIRMAALRLAIIGYGMAGRAIHAHLARKAGLTVTAIVVRDQRRRQQAAADWPGVRILDDVDELVDLRGVFDVAVIASPTSLHAEHAAKLARAGIPFVIDKPMGVDAFEARAIMAEAAKHDTPFTVFHNRRWDSEQLTLEKTLRRGDLGEVHTFERRWERFRPVPKRRWREDDVVGGGLLLDLGAHLVDSATILFGPPRSVTAHIREITTAADDDILLVLEHDAGGGVAQSRLPVQSRLFASTLAAAPGPRTRVTGLKGAFVVTDFEGELSSFELHGVPERKPAKDAKSPLPEADERAWFVRGREVKEIPTVPTAHENFYRDLVAWLREDGPVPVDPRDAVFTADVLDAARMSAREGRSVPLRVDNYPTTPEDRVA